MEFIDDIMTLKEKIEKECETVKTEQATKTAFVMPFLQILGYDVFNPSEVIPEHVADWAEKKGEKVDYAIKVDGITLMLIECKTLDDSLDARRTNQLANYFNHITEVNIGVLTNGVLYKFYTDLKETNIMDVDPFLTFDFRDTNEELISKLMMFTKERIVGTEGRAEIERLRNYSSAIQVIRKEFTNPSAEFAKFVIHQIPGIRAFEETVKEYQLHLKKIIEYQNRAYFKEQLDKLSGQNELTTETDDKDVPISDVSDAIPNIGSDIEFNNPFGVLEEIQGLSVVKSILYNTIPSSKLSLKDWKGHCNVIYDGKSKSIVVRLYFNKADKDLLYIEIPNRDDLGKIRIPNVESMNDHKDIIIESAKQLLES